MPENTEALGWSHFLKLCQQVKNKSQLDELFDLLLTPEEKQNVALRILLLQELLKGEKTQREIAHDLQISIAKITRGSNNLKRINSELRRFLSQM